MRASRHFFGVKIIQENIGISSKYRKIIGTLKNIGNIGMLGTLRRQQRSVVLTRSGHDDEP